MIVERGKGQDIVFLSYHDGLFAFLHDMWARCDGRTSTGLGRESPLLEFVEVFLEERQLGATTGEAEEFTKELLEWCGLGHLLLDVKLEWFLEPDEL
jgi:hypothetical protein